jgi:hypothetical protein
VDASLSPHPDRSACRVLCQDFESAVDLSKAVFNVILDADNKQISTESLLHVAAALNISVFKIRLAIRKHAEAVSSADTEFRSSASVTDFFSSFESHRRPILLSIAALHRIQVPERATVNSLRTQITQHLLSGQCSQFSQSHPEISLSNGLSLPYCADVHNEWPGNKLDPELQVHILTVIYRSNISLNSLRRVLINLNIEHQDSDSIGRLHRRLKRYITELRRGKKNRTI